MPQQLTINRLHVYSLLILLSILSPLQITNAAPGVSASGPTPGKYCPAPGILLITAEDLSSSLDLAMRSRAALERKDRVETLNTLTAIGGILQQAAGRGASARTALLIDSIIFARPNEDNEHLLTWFPMLHTALLALPDEPAPRAADEAVSRAEEILQGDRKGDVLDELKEARHLLRCDGLNLPLQAAIVEQSRLFFKFQDHSKPLTTKDYEKILESLRNAINFILEQTGNVD